MTDQLIIRYLEQHYKKHFGRIYKIRITQLKDKGYYYEFNLWKDNVVTIGESVLKIDIQLYEDKI
ncbi:hypothetical protein [Macrococcus lamae]|uniref:Uncharacterized protein n=1 Tax=Macrococcus lamae TaxID=198484 RepID=A0A4R6BT67_9STAP|nr:hypothetical protein [Macrococcus lamae]TDM07520.1 hypothetical protein ERX29_08785 [Macrococcus lamae]